MTGASNCALVIRMDDHVPILAEAIPAENGLDGGHLRVECGLFGAEGFGAVCNCWACADNYPFISSTAKDFYAKG